MGGWYLTSEDGWSYSSERADLDLRLHPAIDPQARELQIILTGRTGEVSVTVPLTWQEDLMTSPWWAAFGPAETALDCGAGRHRICWSDGTLVPVDHPDAEGELVLAALGGDATPCLDLVRLWGQHSDDLTVFSIGPRSADDKLTITSATLDELPARQHGTGLFSVGRGWSGRRLCQHVAALGAQAAVTQGQQQYARRQQGRLRLRWSGPPPAQSGP